MKTVEHWIGGASTPGSSDRTAEVYNPATGQVQARVLLAGTADVDQAVQTAKKAYAAWQDVSLTRRARIMFAFRNLVEQHADDLARLVSAEHGKVISDAKGEVIRGLEVVEFACGIPQLLKGEFSDQVSTDVDAYSFRQPLGVCAGITPFNFPAMVPMWMHPMAIATGNTFVLKPSERDPSAAMLVAELYAAAGLPDGVFNVVHGDKVAVDALLDHPDVAAISFVGSTPIASYVHRRASEQGKRVQSLGGAKDHAVVLPDADLDFAAGQIISAGYGSAGERCMAISAVVAVGTAGDELVGRLRDQAAGITVGPGDDAASDMGPIVTRQARDRIAGYVSRGEQAGATLVVDGRNLVVDARGRLFHRPQPVRPRGDGHGHLHRRDLRAGPGRAAGRLAGPGDRADQRQPVRQWHGRVHLQRARRAHLPAVCARGHDRCQRPDPRSDGLLFLRRLEGLPVRRHTRARRGRHPVLHPGQGHHDPLAGPPGRQPSPGPSALPHRGLTALRFSG